jgi:putative membrane protein
MQFGAAGREDAFVPQQGGNLPQAPRCRDAGSILAGWWMFGSVMGLLLKWIVPWEFSWVFLASFLLGAVLYWRGARELKVSLGRRLSFWAGMAIIYLSLHTYLDYYAEHEFFMHRIQQVLLHHLAPLLIVASYPGAVLRAGLPLGWRARVLHPAARSRPWRAVSAVLFNPALATILFVAFILVWLIPSMQTLAMLDWRIYRFMNWTMLASGFVYWALVLDHRPRPPGRMTPGLRVLSPAITMTPQILAGAIVTFSRTDLYPIFEICGRAFTFNVLTGQLVGGVIMWVPAAIIESIGALFALRQWLSLSRRGRIRREHRLHQRPVARNA